MSRYIRYDYRLSDISWRELCALTVWLKMHSFSDRTIRTYSSQCKYFFLFCEEHGDDQVDFDKEQMVELGRVYIDQLVRENLARPCSINSFVSAIQKYFEFKNWTERLERPKDVRPVPPVKLDQSERLRFDEIIESTNSSKHSAIARLIKETGLSAQQCSKLNVEDVCLGSRPTIIMKSGARSRYFPISELCAFSIGQWLESRKLYAIADEDASALFLNERGKRVTTSGIDYILRDIGIKAQVVVTSRILRNTLYSQADENIRYSFAHPPSQTPMTK